MLKDFRKAGDVLNGRYLVLGILGKGGSSNVYYGKHIGLDMEVAIKEVSAEKLGKISASNEANLLKEIRHPALPNIMDIFDEDAYTYIIREYCRGEDMRKNIHQTGPYSLEKCKFIAEELSSVLEFLHSQSPPLIYRDLKPSNVIIDEKDEIKLIDFGISRKFDEDKKEDTEYMGSRKYAAPEQFGLGQSSPRTDIYSLGMLLYFMYVGEDYCEIEEEEKWLKFRNEKELRLKEAIIKAINFRPEDRQASSTIFLEEAFSNEHTSPSLNEETELLEGPYPPIKIEPQNFKNQLTEKLNHIGKESLRPKEKKQLGFFGLKSGVGVSHIALSTALAASRRGYRTLLSERTSASGYTLLSSFLNGDELGTEDEGSAFKMEGLTIDLNTSNKALPSLLSEDYDIIIFDFGCSHKNLGDFLRLPYKYFILPSAPYAYNKNLELIGELKQYKDMNYIFNLSHSKTRNFVRYLQLNKSAHLYLSYLDCDVEGDETLKLLDFLNIEQQDKKRRGIIGRFLK